MQYAPSIQFVLMRAKAEAENARQSDPGVEFLFLGLLKLAEVSADRFLDRGSSQFRKTDADINVVKAMLENAHIETTRVRNILRREMQGGKTDSSLMSEYIQRALEYADDRNEDTFWGQDLLKAILKKPTDAILEVCPNLELKDKDEGEKKKPNQTPASDEPEKSGKAFLPELTGKIRRMRAFLLNTVQGQDHVVHAFAEGMFAAEVLAQSDESRKRPRAIFVFAGPPGVGKTFLAEQAAEALGIPFKRFDMSSYADHQAYMGLVGFEKSYQGAKKGTLTGFVKDNPHCFLLFDEIEKAHLNTIQLFLQILDAGRLSDRYLDEEISFKDTIIIFTTNACKSLYEGEARQNAAGVPRQTILSALETETDPRTGQPVFPAAITSRIATGWPLLFSHLQPHDLELISSNEFERFCGLFNKQYSISVAFDKLLPTALLFKEGGSVDARTLRSQTELFFKNEMFKLCRLWGENSFMAALEQLDSIGFTVETDALDDQTRPLFICDERPEILIYGDPVFAERCRIKLTDYVIYSTTNVDEAMRLAGEKDVRLVLIDIGEKSANPLSSQATISEDSGFDLMMSGSGFEYSPMAARAFHDGTKLFRSIHERLPELPIYLLEMPEFAIDTELEMNYVRAGARGKLSVPENEFSVFEERLADISRELYLQSVASKLAGERKVLSFETAPKLSEDHRHVTIRLRDFCLKRATAADDANSILDDVEKPDVHFSDVIGAADAKEELVFFIEYLRNPKKFTAQGLKPPKGVLLYGPPGTGKTMLAKAMAGESDVAFIPAVASSFVTAWQGSGPESVRQLFQKARRYAPAIIFIDEIDAIGRKRSGGNNAHAEEMALNALLTEMDGFSVDPRRPVFVLAATNFDVEEGQGGMGVIDPALARRFDRRILVDLPNEDEREQYLRMQLGKIRGQMISEEMIKRLAGRSMGMSPANLAAVLELAERMAAKQKQSLDDAILDEAFEITRHGEKKNWGRDYLERVARHESGHAFLCYLGGYTPSYLTIVARGDHGGYMEHSSSEMGPLSTRDELINRIRTSLGGRAAEIVYYGERDGISTGASGDLEQATRTALAMICSYGMDEEFGLCVMGSDAANDLAVRNRVNELLRTEMAETVRLIRENRNRIDRMVDELMKKNKLTGQEMEALLAE